MSGTATLTTLVSFNGTDGSGPEAGLIADANGDLFGTTSGGGASQEGTVFEITDTATGYATTPTTLASFDGTDGADPSGSLIVDADGDLFGTTLNGGAYGGGTVFEIVKTSSGDSAPVTLFSFGTAAAGYPGGNHPLGGLFIDASGNLFGTTAGVSARSSFLNPVNTDVGDVFEIAKTATGYASTPTTLVAFTGTVTTVTGAVVINAPNGADPQGSLIADANGDLFGTTQEAGANAAVAGVPGRTYGTVFEIMNTASGFSNTPNTLINFNGQNGNGPEGGLITDANGDLFGVTGVSSGTVFEIVKTANGYASTPTTLASFSVPVHGLTIDANGDLFGTTLGGNINGVVVGNDGTVFEIAKTATGYASTPTTLVTFAGTNGSEPYAGLIADANGNLFGTTSLGGATNQGTVFEITLGNVLSITDETPKIVGQGQSTLIGFVTSTNADILTLTQDEGDGTLSLEGDDIYYTAPASIATSVIDDVSYTIADQHNDTATDSASVQLDAGPKIALATDELAELESGQHTDVAIVTPGLAGDTLTLTQPSTVGPLSLGPVRPDGTQEVIYTATAGAQISEIDSVPYTITDQLGDAATQTASVQLDSGPFLRSTTTGEIAEKGQTISIGLVSPGVPGDDLAVAQTAPSTLRGTLSLGIVLPDGTQQVLYTAPEAIPTSVGDGVGFTVTDQNDDAYASGAVTVKLDAGPTAGNVAATAYFGQTDLTSAILAQVKPGLVGDTETITAVGATSDDGVVTLNKGDVTYNSPSDGSTTDSFTYTVTDQLGGQATGTVDVTVNPVPIDPGPTAGTVAATANVGQTVDLTAAIMAQVKPGEPGDAETITAVGATSAGGVLKLTNGDLTYDALNSNIPANGSVTDTFTYTVTDQLNDTATGTVNVMVSNPAVAINGAPKGNSTINGGSQTNVVTSVKTGNTIIEGGGNDVVNVTAGSANVFTGTGNVVVNLSGKNTTVTGGNGNDTVNILAGSGNNNVTLGTGTDSIVEAATSKGSNTFILNGSDATMTLYGANDVAFIHGGTDIITDNSKGLEVKIGSQGGVITLNNFLADKTGFVDLVGGIGGYKTAKAVIAAIQSDGHGGTMLSLGTAGHIDFANTAMASLTASHFAIG